MSNISWNSTSISSFFNTSLGTSSSSAFSGIYSSLADSKLIKSGSYKKLMTSYYQNVKNTDSKTSSSDKSTSSSKSDSTDSSTDSASTKRKSRSSNVLEELLDKTEKKSTVSNTYLDELLKKNDTTSATYNSSAQKTTSADATTVDATV